jgi:hypothetical protein
MEVGQQRESDAAEFLGESAMRMDAVHADAQHLGIRRLESRKMLLKRGELGSSGVGEVEDVESEHDDPAAQIGQAQRAGTDAGRQREIGRGLADGNQAV